MATSPNANPAQTGKTGLALTYACATMVDVAEGDCYVVDIKQRTELGEEDPKAWNRYLLDMGAEKNVNARMAAILQSLYNAHYNTGTIQEEKDGFSSAGRGRIRERIAPPLRQRYESVERLCTTGASSNCIKDYPLPVFLSPMWQWTLGVIAATHFDKYGMLEEFCIIRAKVLTRQVNSKQRLGDVLIEVEHRDTPRSGGVTERQTWRNLKDLAEQAGYCLVYRFNYIGGGYSGPEIDESFSSVQLERLEPYFKEAQVKGEKNFSYSPTPRLTRLGKSAATIKQLAEAEKNNEDAMDPEKVENGTAPKFKASTAPADFKNRETDTIPIEVGLEAKSNFLVRRTLSNATTNNLITGHWLRTAIPMKKIADHGSMEFMQKKARRGAMDEDKKDEDKKVNEETSSRRPPGESGEDMTTKKRLKGEAVDKTYGGDLYADEDNQNPGGPRSHRVRMQSFQSFKSSSSGNIQSLKTQRTLLENKILSLSIGEYPMPDFLAVLGVPREHTKATSSNFEVNSDVKYVASRYSKEEAAPGDGDPDEKKGNGDPEDKSEDADKDKDNDGQGNIDIEPGSTHLQIDYRLIGLDDELRRLPFPTGEVKSKIVHGDDKSIAKKPDEVGHFSESRFGCAGRTYVRDLVHLTLQYRLPNIEELDKESRKKIKKKADDLMELKKKTEADNQELEIEYKKDLENAKGKKKPKKPELKKLPNSRLGRLSAALKTLGLESLQNPTSWGEYRNRASIITHFVYKEEPWDKVVPPGRMLGIGNFNMLFTGDAFEAGHNESINTPDRRYEFESNWAPHSTSDFSNHVADGNLLAWLWKQNLFTSLRVDVLKLPHHGSSVTTAFSFFRQVSASVYLISACASIHNHPRAEAIKAIVATVLQEDGPARPPGEFSRKGNKDSKKDCISKAKAVAEQDAKDNEDLEFLFNEEVAKYIYGNPTDADFKPGFKNEMFGCHWLRDCPNLRVQSTPPSAADLQAGSANGDQEKGKKKLEIPLANIRFFYQRKPDAATRLRFGRDKNRQDEVRVEWHAEDWVEMRYEWDEQDLNAGEQNARWYTLDKYKWKTEPAQDQGPLENVEDAKPEYYEKYLDMLNNPKTPNHLNATQTSGAMLVYSWYREQLNNAMRMQNPKFERPVREYKKKMDGSFQTVYITNPDPKPECKSLAELYKEIVNDPLAYPYYNDDEWEIPA